MDLSKDEGFKIVQTGKKTNAKPNKLIGEKVEKSVRRAISLLRSSNVAQANRKVKTAKPVQLSSNLPDFPLLLCILFYSNLIDKS